MGKLKWSKEYRDAKEERIKAKDEALKLKDETLNAKDEALRVKEAHIERLKDQIAFLETINPLMLRDYYANTLKGLL